ncbi:MAG TPA: methyltransferase domain-containing protein [Rhizomicrobium sp.]|nr:methyltransferase domain-containing protein [Rhizomicrobium sp.]
MNAHDDATLAFYAKEAGDYAKRARRQRHPKLQAFVDLLKPGAKVLELGCGDGQDSAFMLSCGLDVTPTDGCAELARLAEERLGIPVAVLRFDALEAEDAFDGVWANACLLHVPMSALPDVLARVHRALRPGGVFYASYKAGDGEGRDKFGRYFNFPPREALKRAYESAAGWRELNIAQSEGSGYDGVARTWLRVHARKAG